MSAVIDEPRVGAHGRNPLAGVARAEAKGRVLAREVARKDGSGDRYRIRWLVLGFCAHTFTTKLPPVYRDLTDSRADAYVVCRRLDGGSRAEPAGFVRSTHPGTSRPSRATPGPSRRR